MQSSDMLSNTKAMEVDENGGLEDNLSDEENIHIVEEDIGTLKIKVVFDEANRILLKQCPNYSSKTK